MYTLKRNGDRILPWGAPFPSNIRLVSIIPAFIIFCISSQILDSGQSARNMFFSLARLTLSKAVTRYNSYKTLNRCIFGMLGFNSVIARYG